MAVPVPDRVSRFPFREGLVMSSTIDQRQLMTIAVYLAMKSKQEIRDDGKDWGCERENKEMSLDPRLVKAFVEEICDKTKASRSLV